MLGLGICIFVIPTILYEWLRGTRARHRTRGENYARALTGLIMANRPRYGGYFVHLGIIILAIGIMVSSIFSTSKEVTLTRGQSVNLNSYSLTYSGLDKVETETKVLYTTSMAVSTRGKLTGYLVPEKYYHRNHDNPVTVAAVRSTLFNDLYVILIGWDEDGSASFKVLDNPLVNWIWIGGAVFIFGGLLSFWPGRQKPSLRQEVGVRQV